METVKGAEIPATRHLAMQWLLVLLAAAAVAADLEPTIRRVKAEPPLSNGCPGNNDFYFNGSLFSPGFPGTYQSSVKCYYFMTAELGKVLSFQLYSAKLQPTDTITIYDGPGDSSNVIAVLTGSNATETTYYATTRQSLVVFQAGPSGGKGGFQINFHSVNTAFPCNRDIVMIVNGLASVKNEANFMKQLDFISNHLINSWTMSWDKIRVVLNLQTDEDYAVVFAADQLTSVDYIRSAIAQMGGPNGYVPDVRQNNHTDYECLFRYAWFGEDEKEANKLRGGGIETVVIIFVAQNPGQTQDFYEAVTFAEKMRTSDNTKVITVAMGSGLDVKKIGSLSYGEGFYFGADWNNLSSLVDPINKAICQAESQQCGP